MAVTTTRLIIVCTEDVRTQMNATLNTMDPTSTGDVMVAQVALLTDPFTGVGRWTSWAMTEQTRKNVTASFASTGWAPLKGSEGKVLSPGDAVPAWGTQRFWLFDGVTWDHRGVLSALNLTPIQDREGAE